MQRYESTERKDRMSHFLHREPPSRKAARLAKAEAEETRARMQERSDEPR